MSAGAGVPFRTVRIGEVAASPTEQRKRWLVHSLWPAGAVGMLGGSPKSCKTWLGLDLALSVASGTSCLGCFPVEQPGPVLVYLAEDSLDRARDRVDGMARHRGLDLAGLDLHLITEPVLRLDLPEDRERLLLTIERLRPRLLLLDPFVRLHRINENDSGEVSGILGILRTLQQCFELAVIVVHHARKNGRHGNGEALRGSGDLYAWGDTYLYLQRSQDSLRLSLEHRYERPIDPFTVALVSHPDGSCSHLELSRDRPPSPANELHDAVLAALDEQHAPLTRAALRDRLKVNNNRLGLALAELQASGRLRRTPQGWAPNPAYRSDS